MEADDIYAKQVEQLDKGKKELLVKLKTLEKRVSIIKILIFATIFLVIAV